MKTKTYKAAVTNKETGKLEVITRDDYTSKKDFAHDLRVNGYAVRFISTPEKFDEDCEKYHWELERRKNVREAMKQHKASKEQDEQEVQEAVEQTEVEETAERQTVETTEQAQADETAVESGEECGYINIDSPIRIPIETGNRKEVNSTSFIQQLYDAEYSKTLTVQGGIERFLKLAKEFVKNKSAEMSLIVDTAAQVLHDKYKLGYRTIEALEIEAYNSKKIC